MQKKKKTNKQTKLSGSPSYVKNLKAPLIMDQTYRKASKLNFHWQICGIFFKVPQKGQQFKGPLCASNPQQVFVKGNLIKYLILRVPEIASPTNAVSSYKLRFKQGCHIT